MSGPGINTHGPTVAGYRCSLSKTGVQLAALGAVTSKTYLFGPFLPGCYLIGGYIEIPVAFDAGLAPLVSVGTATYPICCVDALSMSGTKPATAFAYIPDLGGLNINAGVSGDTVDVTIETTGNFSGFTTGSLNVVVLVSAPLQAVSAT